MNESVRNMIGPATSGPITLQRAKGTLSYLLRCAALHCRTANATRRRYKCVSHSPSSKREAIHDGPGRHEAATTTTTTVTRGERYGDQELGRCGRVSFSIAATVQLHGVVQAAVHAAHAAFHDHLGCCWP